MPRKPGTQSNRKTYVVEELVVASFIMQHETWLWRRPCTVTGCDHRMGPKTDEPGWTDWKSCDEGQLPAFVAKKGSFNDAGIACPCHVSVILDQDRS